MHSAIPFPAKREETQLLHENHLSLQTVTHLFARKMLWQCSQRGSVASVEECKNIV